MVCLKHHACRYVGECRMLGSRADLPVDLHTIGTQLVAETPTVQRVESQVAHARRKSVRCAHGSMACACMHACLPPGVWPSVEPGVQKLLQQYT